MKGDSVPLQIKLRWMREVNTLMPVIILLFLLITPALLLHTFQPNMINIQPDMEIATIWITTESENKYKITHLFPLTSSRQREQICLFD